MKNHRYEELVVNLVGAKMQLKIALAVSRASVFS
jgi:hypothetical protein